MRKASLVFLLMCFCIAAAYSQQGYSINFKIAGAKRTSGYALLAYYLGNKQYIADSAQITTGGAITFTGDSALPSGMYLIVFTNENDYSEFLVEDNNQNFSIDFDAANPIQTAKAKNSPGNELFFSYLKFLNANKKVVDDYNKKIDLFTPGYPDSVALYTKKLNLIDKQVKDYQENIVKQKPGSYLACLINAQWMPDIAAVPAGVTDSSSYKFYTYRKQYWNRFPFLDKRIFRTPILDSKIIDYIDNLTTQQPDSIMISVRLILNKLKPNIKAYQYAASMLLNKYAADRRMGFDAVYVGIVNEYYAKGKANWLEAENLKKIVDNAAKLEPILVGKKAPNLNLPGVSGSNISLSGVGAEYTVLFFWNPTGTSYKEEAVKLADLYKQTKNLGLKVYAVASGGKDEWKKEVESNDTGFINVYDELDQRKAYNNPTSPTIYLLDKNKTILVKRIDASQLKDLLRDYYKLGF